MPPFRAVAGGMALRPARPWLVWVALWTVYIVWGSTYLAIRVTVETIPPLLSGGVRFFIAGAIMFLFLTWRRSWAEMRVSGRELLSSLLVGGLLVVGGNGLVSIAEIDVPSGLAALIIASVPLWVALFRTLTRDRVAAGTVAGLALGFAGVAMLVIPGDRPGDAPLFGVLLLVGAAALWSSGSFLSTKLSLPADPFTSTAYQMLLGSALSLVIGIARGEASDFHVDEFSTSSIVGLSYLIVFGSWAAFTAYVWLLQHAPISKVATYAYVNPVIAIFLGWWLVGEEITGIMLVGATVILASVAYIVSHESTAVGARTRRLKRLVGAREEA